MSKKTILGQELGGIDLEEVVMEAIGGDGVSHRVGPIMVGSVQCLILVCTAPTDAPTLVQSWLEVIDNFHNSMREEGSEG